MICLVDQKGYFKYPFFSFLKNIIIYYQKLLEEYKIMIIVNFVAIILLAMSLYRHYERQDLSKSAYVLLTVLNCGIFVAYFINEVI